MCFDFPKSSRLCLNLYTAVATEMKMNGKLLLTNIAIISEEEIFSFALKRLKQMPVLLTTIQHNKTMARNSSVKAAHFQNVFTIIIL